MANLVRFARALLASIEPLGLIALAVLFTAGAAAACKRKTLALGLLILAWQFIALNMVRSTIHGLSYIGDTLRADDVVCSFYWADVSILVFSVPLTCVVLLLAIERTSVRFLAENRFWIVSTLIGLFSVFLSQVWLLAALFPDMFFRGGK